MALREVIKPVARVQSFQIPLLNSQRKGCSANRNREREIERFILNKKNISFRDAYPISCHIISKSKFNH